MTDQLTGGMVICRPKPIRVSAGVTLGFLLQSDLHIGAPHVDYAAIQREWSEAAEHGDRILINGDVFDAILAKDQKRYTPSVVHPKLRGRNDMVNAAADWAVEMMAPYAHLIDVIGVGNHETQLEKWNSSDITKFLIRDLTKSLPKQYKNHVIHYGGYGGFVDYRLSWGTERATRRFLIHYFHGSGGSAPITKGMMDFARRGWVEGVDVVHLGHKHNRFAGHIQAISCPVVGDEPTIRQVRHVMTGAYFKTYGGQTQASIAKHGRVSNYAADWGVAPQGVGGARVLVDVHDRAAEVDVRVVQ